MNLPSFISTNDQHHHHLLVYQPRGLILGIESHYGEYIIIGTIKYGFFNPQPSPLLCRLLSSWPNNNVPFRTKNRDSPNKRTQSIKIQTLPFNFGTKIAVNLKQKVNNIIFQLRCCNMTECPIFYLPQAALGLSVPISPLITIDLIRPLGEITIPLPQVTLPLLQKSEGDAEYLIPWTMLVVTINAAGDPQSAR